MKRTQFTIPGELPSLNEIVKKANLRGKKYQAYAQMKERYTLLCKSCCPRGITIEYADLITFLWITKDRKKDKDNIRGGAKFILDGMEAARMIPRDSYKHIGSFHDDYGVDKLNPRTEVTVGHEDN